MCVSWLDSFPFCTNKHIETRNYSSFHNTKELLNVSLVLCQKTQQEFLMWLSIGNNTDREAGIPASTISPAQHINVRDLSYAASMKMCVMATPCLQYQSCQQILARSQNHSLFSNEKSYDKRNHNEHQTYWHKSLQMQCKCLRVVHSVYCHGFQVSPLESTNFTLTSDTSGTTILHICKSRDHQSTTAALTFPQKLNK